VAIELIVLDVDGCLSDGKVIYSERGEELKAFDVKDGLGIATWIRMGKRVAIITGRESDIVQRRAKELGIEYCEQGVKNKKKRLKKIVEKLDIDLESVAGIGDDYNDYLMLKSVGLSFSPSDAIEEIKDIVNIVLNRRGGDGAVREMIDTIVEMDGLKERFKRVWSIE
jgi:3-deoxy-D-manno-octulosonate 8-phosphate phosphatase (KDO 8-P phosphatase)